MQNILEKIQSFNSDRSEKTLPLKFEMMKENIFKFYRGSCHLFYEDLASCQDLPSSPLVWVCGDLHLENFGTFRGDNRLVYFDLNDFDEALLAPATYELVRMVCSIFVAFQTLKIDINQAIKMSEYFLKAYAAVLAKGKALYIEPQTAKGIVCTFLTAVNKRKQDRVLKKRTITKKNGLGILMKHPRHFRIEKSLKTDLTKHLNEWIKTNSDSPYNFEVVDLAFRLAGTGSVGLKRYLFLLKSTNQKNKYMLVEMKQATSSSLLKFIEVNQPNWTSEAHRIVSVQQKMQNIPPALLSHTSFKGESYIVQEMQPTKDSFNFKLIKDRYRDLHQVIGDMAALTASSQIRSASWKGAATLDNLIEFGENDTWQQPLLQYGQNYMAKVEKDFNEFKTASETGNTSQRQV